MKQLLVEHVGRGERLDLTAGDEAVDEAAMRSWGDSRTCPASVIRDILRGRLAADPDPHGLQLRGARITGRLDLENLTTDVALELKDCLLEEGVLARDARLASLGLVGCQLEHPAEPPLDGARLTCSALALAGVRIIGHANDGAVNLTGAHIGQLNCIGAKLRNDSGPALNADSLQADQGMFLRDEFTAVGSGVLGTVNLVGAHISGSLECDGAKLCNDSGPALIADGLQVGQDLFLRGGFTAVGSGGLGAIRLVGAHISGNLECDGAKLRNDSGPALNAGTLQVGQAMFLRDGFTAIGGGGDGAVNLTSANIGGQLEVVGAELCNDSGPALNAGTLQVGQAMFLRGGFTGGGEGAVVNLSRARVGGTFLFAARLEHKVEPHRRLAVDGLTYTSVPVPISPQGWRELLRHGTPRYAAQPYQQLAAGYRALGDERQARETLMAQRDDQLARTHRRRQERWWGWITKYTLGYGYKPWRALVFLTGVVAVSCLLAWSLGAHGALAQTSETATPGRSCTVVQQVSVGLDLNLPVGTSMSRAGCDLTSDAGSVTGAWLSVAGWVLRVLAWAFAALFFAGFTSAVRKA
jgi:hypothetical protein